MSVDTSVCLSVTGCATAELCVPSPAQGQGQGQGQDEGEGDCENDGDGVILNSHDVISAAVTASSVRLSTAVTTRTYVNSLLVILHCCRLLIDTHTL